MLRFVAIVAALVALGAPAAHAQDAAVEDASADDDGCGPARPGCFLDPGGAWRDVGRAYDARRDAQEPDHWQTTAEMLLFLGGGTAWYVIDDRNVADWDFESWEQRFDERSFAFDNNSFDINFIWHPMSGAGWHASARANGQSFPMAALYGFLTSAAWELVIEFKERTSVNDLIVTTGAGIPIGEFAYQLALDVQNEGAIARWTVGLPVALHDAIDGRETRSVDLWRRLHLSYGVGPSRVDGADGPTLHTLRMDGRIASLPGYLRPGRFEHVLSDGDVVSLDVQVTASSEGTGLDVLSDVFLLALHRQSIAPGPGGLHGEAVTVGTSLGFQYRNERYGDWKDQLSITGLPGAALDTHVLAGPVELHLRGRLHAAFAGLYAAGFDAWAEDHPDARPKSILLKQGYYFGWGYWGRLEAELRLGSLELAASVAYGAFDSQEGLDRTQDLVTADVDVQDTALEWALRARWAPFGRGVFVEGGAAGQRRQTALGGNDPTRRMLRLGASLGLRL